MKTQDWLRRAENLSRGHWETARILKRRYYYLGVPATILAFVVGASLFATLESSSSSWQIGAGVVSMIAAVLAGMQTFLNYGDRARKHEAAGNGFSSIRRDLEILSDSPPSEDKLGEALERISGEMKDIGETAPAIPQRVKNKVFQHPPSDREPALSKV